jgi:DNA repair protein RecO (recombination protein O)
MQTDGSRHYNFDMPLESSPAICLRKTEYSETSQILRLLTREQGIIRAIAKGAHRRTKAGASRFDGGIDLLDLGDAIFSADASRELAILTDWKLQDGHLALRKNLRPIYLAIYAADLVGTLLEEHDSHPEVFDLLQKVLIDLASPSLEEAFLAFQLDLLQEAGFTPEFGICVNCSKPVSDRDNVYFTASRGGVVCHNCHATFADRIPFDIRLNRLIRMIQSPTPGQPRRLPRLTRHQTDPLNNILVEHLEYSLGRPPNSAYYILARRSPPKEEKRIYEKIR